MTTEEVSASLNTIIENQRIIKENQEIIKANQEKLDWMLANRTSWRPKTTWRRRDTSIFRRRR